MKAELFMLSALTETGKASLAVCSPLQISPTSTSLQPAQGTVHGWIQRWEPQEPELHLSFQTTLK